MELSVRKRGSRPWWMTPFGREPMGDVFFDRLWPESYRLWPEWQRGEEWTPVVDFYEKDGKYFFTAELPGLTKDDISVTVDSGVVTVTGKKETKREEQGANFYIKESSYGSFSRTFRLPVEVEEEKIDAKFKDGVLTLEMPHKKGPEVKKIDIK